METLNQAFEHMERLGIGTGVGRNVLDNLSCLHILVKPTREKNDRKSSYPHLLEKHNSHRMNKHPVVLKWKKERK